MFCICFDIAKPKELLGAGEFSTSGAVSDIARNTGARRHSTSLSCAAGVCS
jgi:hypothetical protein